MHLKFQIRKIDTLLKIYLRNGISKIEIIYMLCHENIPNLRLNLKVFYI